MSIVRSATVVCLCLAIAACGKDKKPATTPTTTDTTATDKTTPAADPAADKTAPADKAAPADKTAAAPVAPPAMHLYMDEHDLGAGKVKAKDVAEAHKKDLAVEGKYHVDFKAYWVDEKAGKVYCLAEAAKPEDITATHKEAHGLMPAKILPVTAAGEAGPIPAVKGMHLYLDVHELGAGKVTPEAVADAHKKDLAVQGKYKVSFLDYWVDPESGTVMCLAQAPSADAAIKTHKEAHGLVPKSMDEVVQGAP